MVYYARRVSSRVRTYGRTVRRRRTIGQMANRRPSVTRRRVARPMRIFTSPTTTAATNIYRLLQGPASAFPRSVMAKLRYGYEQFFDTSGNAMGSAILRANSLYDPEYATGGHQPRYFDQICAQGLYLHYLVKKMKYTIDLPVQQDGSPWIIMVQASLSPTIVPSSVESMANTAELPYSQIHHVDQASSRTVSGIVDMAKLFGITNQDLMNNWTQYGGSYGADPTDVVYLKIHIMNGSHNSGSGDCWAPISLEFEALFDRRDNVGLS